MCVYIFIHTQYFSLNTIQFIPIIHRWHKKLDYWRNGITSWAKNECKLYLEN